MGRHHRPEDQDATVDDGVSDPAKGDQERTDWTDEGGATPDGPAVDTDSG